MLEISATATKASAPISVGVTKKCQLTPPSMTIKGLEPAGGCGTRSNSISAIAVPTASDKLHHSIPNKVKNDRPVKVVIR